MSALGRITAAMLIALTATTTLAQTAATVTPYVFSVERKVKIKSLIMSNLHYLKGETVPTATADTATIVAHDTSADDIATLIELTRDEEGTVRTGAQRLLALYGDKSLAEIDRQMAAESDPDAAYFMKRTRGAVKRFIKR